MDLTQLADFLRQHQDAMDMAIKVRSDLKLNAKDVATKTIPNPHKNSKFIRVTSIAGTINASYEDRVNTQQLAEGKKGEFKAQGLPWGTADGKNLVKHNGQTYIKFLVNTTTKQEIRDNHGRYFSANELAPFIPASSSNSHQGVKDEVKVRIVNLDNVLELHIPSLNLHYKKG